MSINIYQSVLLLSGCLLFSSAQSTQITIVNKDGIGIGLNDPAPATPVTGNTGTTKGQQALNVFQAAVDYWETRLHSPVQIKVNMQFRLLNCNANSATLGSAGASSNSRDFLNAPRANTWYPIALARSLAGSNLYPSTLSDIKADFNSGIGQTGCLESKSWSYEISDLASPAGTSSLYKVALHEIGHGLGFATLVNENGRRGGYTDGAGVFHPFDDNYMTFLKDTTSNLDWTAMTNAQRAASAISGVMTPIPNTNPVSYKLSESKLIWTGAKAVAEATPLLTSGKNGSNPTMNDPNPYQGGSSVSHWSITLTPDELMEPSLTATSKNQLTVQAFYDMHWVDPCRITKNLVAGEWVQISLPCVAPSNANTVADIIGDDMTGTYGTDWVVYSYNPVTNAYVNPGLSSVMESGKGYWIIQVGSAATLDMPHNSAGVSSSVSGQCQSTNDCFEIGLATASSANQWQMIGTPYRDKIKVVDMRLHKNNGVSTCHDADGCTFTESNTNTLAANQLWSYNGSSYVDLLLGAEIDPWTGAWLATLSGSDGSSPKLFLPNKEAIPSGS